MSPPRFRYKVQAEVKFTAAELSVLHACAAIHYDRDCQKFFDWPNAGSRWRGNGFALEPNEEHPYGEAVDPLDPETCPPDLECKDAFGTFREIDLACKVLEMGPHLQTEHGPGIAMGLTIKLRGVLRSINEESTRLHEAERQRHGEAA